MAGYFGSDTQQRLQAQAEESADFIARTPGACQTARIMGCDDPSRLGWDHIGEIIRRDGVFGFRLIPTSEVEHVRVELAALGSRLDTWDVFLADRDIALAATRDILAKPLPDGVSLSSTPTDPESNQVKDLQAMMASSGLVPFSGSMLTGEFGPATTAVMTDAGGSVVASAHGHMPHNAHSRFERYAWGGLVAVAEPHRGKGLGKQINAQMIEAVFRDLGATNIYELVSATNLPSRRMVEACGLRLEPNLTCGIATLNDTARFTK